MLSMPDGNKRIGTDDVRKRFDRAAAEWDANPTRGEMARRVAEAIRQAVPLRKDMDVLDFGAGTGLLTLALLPDVHAVTAVDASAGMLGVLEGKLQALGIANVRTKVADVAEASLPQGAVDLVVSSMAMHHMPDVAAVIKRLRGCLRPGGWIAIADLQTEDGTFHADPTGVYHNGFEPRELCDWLRQAGFADPATREAHRIVRTSADGTSREYPILLAAARCPATASGREPESGKDRR
jgi:ubiquinone/menaquinone biosynthesis C-methylase UbiE